MNSDRIHGSLMPWQCPACSTPLPHNPLEPAPSLKAVYRCAVCRLEFIWDALSAKLVVAPLPETTDTPPKTG